MAALDVVDDVRAPPPVALTDVSARSPQPPLSVGGALIPRLENPPTAPGSAGKRFIDFVFGTGVAPFAMLLGKEAQKEPDVIPWRTATSARQAMSVDLPVPVDGAKKPFGPLTILRPGLGNLGPSAAMVFRAAQYTDKVVLAYSNMTDPKHQHLEPATQIDGVRVPPELRGRVFTIGSPEHNLINYCQASDVFLQQLEVMHREKQALGLDPLSSKATVIGHSQGGLESLLSRKRLEEAGFGDAVGRLVAVASPFRGSSTADNVSGMLMRAVSTASDIDDGLQAVHKLNPDIARKIIREEDQGLVDLSLAATIRGEASIRPHLGFPPFEVKDQYGVRPVMRLLAGLSTASDAGGLSFKAMREVMTRHIGQQDGLVSEESAHFGKECAVLEHPYDHLGVWEDYRVMDEIVARLPA